MSRVGQAIINIPDGIEVKQDGNKFWAKGSKGELSALVSDTIKIIINEIKFNIFISVKWISIK